MYLQFASLTHWDTGSFSDPTFLLTAPTQVPGQLARLRAKCWAVCRGWSPCVAKDEAGLPSRLGWPFSWGLLLSISLNTRLIVLRF